MAESKSAALPLGYAPSGCCRNGARKPTLRHRRSIEGVGLFQQARPLNSGKNGPAAPVSICSCLYIVAAECNGGLLCRGRREPPWRPSRADRTVETIAVSWEDGSPLFPFGDKSRRVPLMTYRAPISDILLALNHGAGLKAAVQAGHYGDFDGDITAAVLEEAGKFAGEVLAPLNRVGDEHGIKLADNKVTTAPGWPDAYQRWAAAGWNAVSGPEAFGGQGLPLAVNAACTEIW